MVYYNSILYTSYISYTNMEQQGSGLSLLYAALVVAGYEVFKATNKPRSRSSGIGSVHPARALHKECVYLDYNATTPIFPEVSAAMQPYLLVNFGNPSSPHIYGRCCQSAVEAARQHVANLVRAPNVKNVSGNITAPHIQYTEYLYLSFAL